MPKRINPIRKNIVKQSILEGKSFKQSVLRAGYSPNSAINAYRLNVVKCCQEEIEREFKLANITVEQVMKDIETGKQISLKLQDMSNYKGFCELEGKYLALFTDKQQVNANIVSKQEQDILSKYISSNRIESLASS